MAKRSSLVEAVVARVTREQPGFRTWFQKLPADVQKELEQVRVAFNPSIHQKRSYARAVIEVARENGWEISGVQGVIAWLDRKR